MGKFTIEGTAKARGANATLEAIARAAAAKSPYDVELFSGKRGNPLSRHGKNAAIDIVLRDPVTGREIPNLASSVGYPAYESFARQMREAQMEVAPQVANDFRWGGWFGPSKLNRSGVDLMHFDLKPGGAMSLGNWTSGLTQRGKQHIAKLGPGQIYSARGQFKASPDAFAGFPASYGQTITSGAAGSVGRNSSPDRVSQLQSSLERWGFSPGVVDGQYGPATTKAIKEFQASVGLTPDGQAGPQTLARLQDPLGSLQSPPPGLAPGSQQLSPPAAPNFVPPQIDFALPGAPPSFAPPAGPLGTGQFDLGPPDFAPPNPVAMGSGRMDLGPPDFSPVQSPEMAALQPSGVYGYTGISGKINSTLTDMPLANPDLQQRGVYQNGGGMIRNQRSPLPTQPFLDAQPVSEQNPAYSTGAPPVLPEPGPPIAPDIMEMANTRQRPGPSPAAYNLGMGFGPPDFAPRELPTGYPAVASDATGFGAPLGPSMGAGRMDLGPPDFNIAEAPPLPRVDINRDIARNTIRNGLAPYPTEADLRLAPATIQSASLTAPQPPAAPSYIPSGGYTPPGPPASAPPPKITDAAFGNYGPSYTRDPNDLAGFVPDASRAPAMPRMATPPPSMPSTPTSRISAPPMAPGAYPEPPMNVGALPAAPVQMAAPPSAPPQGRMTRGLGGTALGAGVGGLLGGPLGALAGGLLGRGMSPARPDRQSLTNWAADLARQRAALDGGYSMPDRDSLGNWAEKMQRGETGPGWGRSPLGF